MMTIIPFNTCIAIADTVLLFILAAKVKKYIDLVLALSYKINMLFKKKRNINVS